MNNHDSRLALTASEKKMLRSNGITLKDVAKCPIEKIRYVLNTSTVRAMEIKALSEFQTIPSVGSKFAHDLVSMGFYSLNELKNKNPVKLYDKFEKMVGAWADPCLEDQFRLVIHYANDQSTKKNWWDFTSERKNYREKNGYSSTRPTRPWYKLDQYKKENKIPAKSVVAKKELLHRIKQSMRFIKKNYTEKITLQQLSKIALLSPFHFQRSFKSVYEVSPLEFVTHLRLKKACQLLRKTKKSVSEIAIKSGFENSSSFIRLFKERFKQTPLEFRNNEREA